MLCICEQWATCTFRYQTGTMGSTDDMCPHAVPHYCAHMGGTVCMHHGSHVRCKELDLRYFVAKANRR